MAAKGSAVRFWRIVHLYFGLFISPALIFFALTGIAQTLSLHEAAGSAYKPPAWLATMGQIHKKQTWQLPVRHESASPSAARDTPSDPKLANQTTPKPQATSPGPQQPRTLWAKERQHLPLKIFFVTVSLGLLVSTATGIYMAYIYRNSRLWVTVALLAGVILPLVLLPF